MCVVASGGDPQSGTTNVFNGNINGCNLCFGEADDSECAERICGPSAGKGERCTGAQGGINYCTDGAHGSPCYCDCSDNCLPLYYQNNQSWMFVLYNTGDGICDDESNMNTPDFNCQEYGYDSTCSDGVSFTINWQSHNPNNGTNTFTIGHDDCEFPPYHLEDNSPPMLDCLMANWSNIVFESGVSQNLTVDASVWLECLPDCCSSIGDLCSLSNPYESNERTIGLCDCENNCQPWAAFGASTLESDRVCHDGTEAFWWFDTYYWPHFNCPELQGNNNICCTADELKDCNGRCVPNDILETNPGTCYEGDGGCSDNENEDDCLNYEYNTCDWDTDLETCFSADDIFEDFMCIQESYLIDGDEIGYDWWHIFWNEQEPGYSCGNPGTGWKPWGNYPDIIGIDVFVGSENNGCMDWLPGTDVVPIYTIGCTSFNGFCTDSTFLEWHGGDDEMSWDDWAIGPRCEWVNTCNPDDPSLIGKIGACDTCTTEAGQYVTQDMCTCDCDHKCVYIGPSDSEDVYPALPTPDNTISHFVNVAWTKTAFGQDFAFHSGDYFSEFIDEDGTGTCTSDHSAADLYQNLPGWIFNSAEMTDWPIPNFNCTQFKCESCDCIPGGYQCRDEAKPCYKSCYDALGDDGCNDTPEDFMCYYNSNDLIDNLCEASTPNQWISFTEIGCMDDSYGLGNYDDMAMVECNYMGTINGCCYNNIAEGTTPDACVDIPFPFPTDSPPDVDAEFTGVPCWQEMWDLLIVGDFDMWQNSEDLISYLVENEILIWDEYDNKLVAGGGCKLDCNDFCARDLAHEPGGGV